MSNVPNQSKLYRYFRDNGIQQCNVYGVGDIWRNGVLSPMTEEFAAEMLAMIEAPSVPATFDAVDGPCDCCTKNSDCCLREGHRGDCNTSMADQFKQMMEPMVKCGCVVYGATPEEAASCKLDRCPYKAGQ